MPLILLTLFTLIANIQAKTQEKRQTSGIILPMKQRHWLPIIEFTNMVPDETQTPFPPVIRLFLRSICSQSLYFSTSRTSLELPFLPVRLGVTPVLQQRVFEFDGWLAPFRTTDWVSTATGILCMKSPNIPNDPFANFLSRFPSKVISFWFTDEQTNGDVTVGELSVGMLNEARMGRTRITFPLKSLTFDDQEHQAPGWITRDAYSLKLGSREYPDIGNHLVFAFVGYGLRVPDDVFQMIVKELKTERKKALIQSKPTMPEEILMNIYEYADTKRVIRFDCQYAPKLPDLQFGELKIPKEMLYMKNNGGKCSLLVSANQGQDRHIFFGSSILQQYVFSVDFNSPGDEFAMFASKRTPADTILDASEIALGCIRDGIIVSGCTIA